mmetsp:Transcript_48994/g.98588  ORF Transcript_48994/g.98588 Transcript_48994/m.98588 type:complete len:160 (-) Transcript_48994:246-725(-)
MAAIEVCRAFRNTGKCRNGDECKFEHSTGDVIVPPPAGECFNFQQTGECKFGDRCRFTHGEADFRFDEEGRRIKTERKPRAVATGGEDGDADGTGGGEKKKRDRKKRIRKPREDRPPREKLDEVCNNYLAGKCRYGDNCRRQHPGDIPQTNIVPKEEME